MRIIINRWTSFMIREFSSFRLRLSFFLSALSGSVGCYFDNATRNQGGRGPRNSDLPPALFLSLTSIDFIEDSDLWVEEGGCSRWSFARFSATEHWFHLYQYNELWYFVVDAASCKFKYRSHILSFLIRRDCAEDTKVDSLLSSFRLDEPLYLFAKTNVRSTTHHKFSAASRAGGAAQNHHFSSC